MSGRSGVLAALLLAAGTGAPAGAGAQAVAIRYGDVHTITGDVIRGGTVVIEGQRIVAVGRDADVPAGARIVDATGMVVTPGFLDSRTTLGLVEIGAAEGTVDASTEDDRITAAFNPLDGINPASTLIPISRAEGITRAVVAPGTGASLIAGQGVLIDLGGRTVPDMVIVDPAAMFVSLGETGAGFAGGARGAAMLTLREAFQDARDYAQNRAAFERGDRRGYALSRLDLEALVPVVNGELPLVVAADRASDIRAALRLRRDFGLRMIIAGAGEGWVVADELAAAAVPVLLNPLVNLPTFETLRATYENAARLDSVGVRVAFASFDAHNSRNLKQAAGHAVAYGMGREAALRAVTLNPALIWGIDARYGSLTPGRDGDVVVWSGDPFELDTRVEHVFIQGEEVPLDTRQKALFERYRNLDDLPPE